MGPRRERCVSGMLFPEPSENPWPTAPLRSAADRGDDSGLLTVELCAGAGGQALGFERAGIGHAALVEIDKHACMTLRANRPDWNVHEQDLREFKAEQYAGVDIVSGGLPCPPFSIAGKQLGPSDERNLFPTMIHVVDAIRPRAVVIENVRGILEAVFEDYRVFIAGELSKMGYRTGWKLMNASDFGVPQLRPRVVFVGLAGACADRFAWPRPGGDTAATVAETIGDLVGGNGWRGARRWRELAQEVAPTVVGGSHKHGGPDLGPTRARKAWAALGIDGIGIADDAPGPTFAGMPRLTLRMVARIQGFPDEWQFAGGKTHAYRQIGNAFPPPFARAVAGAVVGALGAARRERAS